MITKVQQYIKSMHMIEEGDGIVVGVSGGADSVALLLVLVALRQEKQLSLYGVHINHGIRQEAGEDAEYVRQLCEQLEVPFYLYEADVPAMAAAQGATEEEMGRNYRYQCFEEVMEREGATRLAVAHHMDDQAETMLFHLIRGSRVVGMEGMRPVSVLHGNQVIRPLLCCRKQEITEWLSSKRIEWKEDYTNGENTYARNRIRNQVMPVLETVNEKAVLHMADFAEEMAEYRGWIERIVKAYMEQEVEWSGVESCSVNRGRLLQQEKLLQRAVIYEMLTVTCGCRKDIGSVHVQAVCGLLENQSGKKIFLPHEMEAEISYEKLIIRKSLQEVRTFDEVALKEVAVDITWEKLVEAGTQGTDILLWDGKRLRVHLYQKNQCSEVEWTDLVKEAGNSKNNYAKFFEYDTIKDTLRVRPTKQNDFIVIQDTGTRKKVSRYFIDEKIPTWQRGHIPMLAVGKNILWIIGRRRCEEYKVSEQSELIIKMTYEGE